MREYFVCCGDIHSESPIVLLKSGDADLLSRGVVASRCVHMIAVDEKWRVETDLNEVTSSYRLSGA
jgi:hypothetical protein